MHILLHLNLSLRSHPCETYRDTICDSVSHQHALLTRWCNSRHFLFTSPRRRKKRGDHKTWDRKTVQKRGTARKIWDTTKVTCHIIIIRKKISPRAVCCCTRVEFLPTHARAHTRLRHFVCVTTGSCIIMRKAKPYFEQVLSFRLHTAQLRFNLRLK